MARMSGWMRAVLIAGATLTTAACMSYPSEPRYSTRATPAPGQMGGAYPAPQGQGQMQGGYPAPAQTQPYSPPSPMATAKAEKEASSHQRGSLCTPSRSTP